MRLLRVLHLAGVDARRVRHVLRAVQFPRLPPRGVDRGLRQRRRVGPHIRDVTVLVQPLRHRHRVLGREAELAGCLLLERGGAERRVRGSPVRLALDRLDREVGALEPVPQTGRGHVVHHARWHRRRAVVSVIGRGPGEVQGITIAQLTRRGEVTALGDPAPVHRDQPGRERRRTLVSGAVGPGKDPLEVPVTRGAEGDPLAFPGDDEPGGHGLDPSRRQPGHDLLPQHRRDLIAVQPVQHPPGLVGVDKPGVQLAGVVHRVRDGLRRDLVEDHSPGRHLGLEFLEEVPGDGLALAVLISGEVELVGVLEQGLELRDLGPLVGVHHVQRAEVIVDVDPEPRPRLLAVLLGDLGSLVRHVADVPDAGLHHVPLAEVARNGPRLGRRFDDNQASTPAVARGVVLTRRTFPGGRCPCCHAFTF